jgi:phosphatidylglycerophosphate synthase
MKLELTLFLGALSTALLSMLVFRMTVGGREVRSDEVARRGSFVLGNWVREWFYWSVRPVERVSVRLGLPPEVFNGIGLLFGIASGIAFALGYTPAGGALLLLSGITDAFDGLVARARNVVSKAGAFLDSTLDRFTELAAFVGLVAYYRSTVPLVAVAAALGGSLLVSYTRARGESLGVTCKLGVMQRAERLLLLGIGSILDPTISALLGRPEGTVLVTILVLIAVGSLGTAVFRTYWIWRRVSLP